MGAWATPIMAMGVWRVGVEGVWGSWGETVRAGVGEGEGEMVRGGGGVGGREERVRVRDVRAARVEWWFRELVGGRREERRGRWRGWGGLEGRRGLAGAERKSGSMVGRGSGTGKARNGRRECGEWREEGWVWGKD